MIRTAGEVGFVHRRLNSGVEFAADVLPDRDTVGLVFRMLSGAADDPLELGGIGAIVERTLSKGTQRFDGRGLADAFDALGAQWSTATGRQSTLVRVVCLPEFAPEVVDLVAEMLVHPTFPDEACRVAVELAQQDLKQLEDDAGELVRLMIQRLTFGPVLGRYTGGSPETLARIDAPQVREHWARTYHSGRLQVGAAGPVDADALAERLEARFHGLGRAECDGRGRAEFEFQPAREHRHKELKQQQIAITLPGARRDDPEFPVEQVLIGVLSGGMSGRLFTEVREKQGLVYWVGAWHEHPRGAGVLHLGASTTPERCHQTLDTLLRELRRVSEDLTDVETRRARDSLIAHALTEDDLTRARASGLSDDLFHFSRPIGLQAKLDALRAVTVAQVADYARRLPIDRICVATLGPREL